MTLFVFVFKILTFLQLFGLVITQFQYELIRDRDPEVYTHFEMLDQKGKYFVEWVVHWSEQRIQFDVTVETRGYVGFGLSEKGKMQNADIVIGGVFPDGTTYFTDRHANGYREPVVDNSQDWTLHFGWENSTHTFLRFSRALNTCDKDDYQISEFETVALIWTYGESDNSITYHYQNRGHYPVYLLDPNIVPPSMKKSSFSINPPSRAVLLQNNLNVWTISTRVQLPAKETTYLCTIHKGPRLRRKHHLIGFNARLSELAKRHMHHMAVYRCTPPPPPQNNLRSADIFGQFVNSPGEECYFLSMPTGQIPTNYCTSVTVGWGIGGRISFYPDHIGLPIGESSDDDYYLLQVHYDNPDKLSDLEFQVDLDAFYTSRLRAHDAGIMTIGHHIPGSPSILVPPSSLAHNIYGHCGGQCTRKMLPKEGITVSFMALHTHYSGSKIIVKHFRGREELPWISSDQNFDSTYQTFKVLNGEAHIMPGDHLMIRCEYDNTWTNGTVVGGFSTRQEMCLTYLFYYNRIPDYSLCRSEIVDEQYMEYYLGVRNITWDNTKLDYVATSPQRLSGRSMSEISDSVNWTIKLREELKEDHRRLAQVNVCSRSPFSSTSQGQVETDEETNLVVHPVNIREYLPPSASNACTARTRTINKWQHKKW